MQKHAGIFSKYPSNFMTFFYQFQKNLQKYAHLIIKPAKPCNT